MVRGGTKLSDKPVKTRFSVTLNGPLLKGLRRLVKEGPFIDPQEAMRDGLRHILQEYGIDVLTIPEQPEESR